MHFTSRPISENLGVMRIFGVLWLPKSMALSCVQLKSTQADITSHHSLGQSVPAQLTQFPNRSVLVPHIAVLVRLYQS